jgi:hypothetical protein
MGLDSLVSGPQDAQNIIKRTLWTLGLAQFPKLDR